MGYGIAAEARYIAQPVLKSYTSLVRLRMTRNALQPRQIGTFTLVRYYPRRWMADAAHRG